MVDPLVLGLAPVVSGQVPGDSEPALASADAAPPNVVLIVCDTLRADHLGCYGYERATSPAIDAFAAVATRFERAQASAPWTLPTHASLFTGMHPFEHGVRTYEPQGPKENLRPLAEEHLTLAEVLKGLGYATAGFIANTGWFNPIFQLQQGFDEWELRRSPAQRLNARVFSWLSARAEQTSGQPFFLFLNYVDTHYVYNTEPRPGLLETPVLRDQGELLHELTERVMGEAQGEVELLTQQVIDQYDTAIANLDEGVGGLLAELKRLGLYDNTVIVLTSDHGEFFGEHRLVEHCKDVYQEVLNVPLIAKSSGQSRGRLMHEPTSSADVAGMILAELPAHRVGGLRSLFPNLPGRAPVVSENYWARARDLSESWGGRFQRTRHVLLEWPHKLISSSDGQHELYDLEADPLEAHNLASESSPQLAAMLERLQRLMESPRVAPQDAPAVELNEELRETLRALGYLGEAEDG